MWKTTWKHTMFIMTALFLTVVSWYDLISNSKYIFYVSPKTKYLGENFSVTIQKKVNSHQQVSSHLLLKNYHYLSYLATKDPFIKNNNSSITFLYLAPILQWAHNILKLSVIFINKWTANFEFKTVKNNFILNNIR